MIVYIYAQLDEQNICVGLSRLSGVTDLPYMVLIEEFNPDLLGKQWDGEKFLDSA
ncbi:hypothetical protein [Desulforamulus ruminis]|uniref:Uncharacterized protein n=1 Tax=Desulforamulus ruminis (strain ATCC 23193 / DSM 2154 / NCIMB 8452 / DL) TaxID=696281 RepID=F6DM32_DESRL|nr:hypothetical protein [Desulforamulus ruminis]AEG59374.1 hypothetical protein Desru_1099 [Desulforamulus ruminis DSM 2154]